MGKDLLVVFTVQQYNIIFSPIILSCVCKMHVIRNEICSNQTVLPTNLQHVYMHLGIVVNDAVYTSWYDSDPDILFKT